MADTSYYVFDNGILAADTATILVDVQATWRNAFGETLSVDATTPQGRIIELETAREKLCVDLCAFVANQFDPSYSTGQFLDAYASIFGINRVASTPSLVYATITGDPGTIVGKGFIAKTTAGNEFVTKSDVTIGNSGTVDQVLFYSKQDGAIPCAAGTLTNIVTTQPGVTAVSNPSAPYYIGTTAETDAELRPRISDSRYSREALPDSVKSALNAVIGVKSYWFYNNGKGTTVWISPDGEVVDTDPSDSDYVAVDPHSVILVVYGGSNDDIANALFITRSAGCGFTALPTSSLVRTVPVTSTAGAFNIGYEVVFNRPAEVPIDYSVTVKKGSYTGTDAELTEAVKAAVVAWTDGKVDNVDKPEIGDTIYTYEIGAAISDLIPEIIIKDVKIATHGNTLGYAPINTNKAQIITISTATVTVEA